MPRAARTVALAVALGGAYAVAAQLGFRASFVAQQVTTVWAPTGIAQAALLLWGIKLWPGVWLGAFSANALTQVPLWTAAGIATGNTLEAVAAAWILPRVHGFDPAMTRTRAAVAFILIAVVASPLISASIGVTMLSAGGVAPWAQYAELWREWWLGDALGALVVAPAILTTVRAGRQGAQARELEVIGLVALTAVTTQLVSGRLLATPIGNPPLAFVIFPFVIVAAVRLGQPATALVTFSAAAIIILNTLQGYRPFGAGTIHENVLLVHVFMGVLAGSGLLLAAAITERRVLERRRAATYAAGSAIAGSTSLEQAASGVLGAICSNLGWQVGAFWLVDPELDRLRCVTTWADHEMAPGFLTVTKDMTFASGSGLPGRVWATCEPAWIEDVVDDPNFPRASAAREARLHGGFAFPIRRNDEILGVVEFFSESIAAVDLDLLATMGSIGYQIGDFLTRIKIEAIVIEEQTRSRAILETALDAIISIDHRGRVTEFNRAAERMFGYARSQTIGQELASLIIPRALRDGHRAGLETYLRTGIGPFMNRRIETAAVTIGWQRIPCRNLNHESTNGPSTLHRLREGCDRAGKRRAGAACIARRRARCPARGGSGKSREGRVSGHVVARAPHPVERHRRMDADAARRNARRTERTAGARDCRPERSRSGAAGHRSSRRVARHHGEALAQSPSA